MQIYQEMAYSDYPIKLNLELGFETEYSKEKKFWLFKNFSFLLVLSVTRKK